METVLAASHFFASSRPSALELPHLITALDAELIGKIAHLTKAKLGLWNVPAPFDEQDIYERAREAALLSAWTLPANQAEILSFGALVQEAIFGTKLMILDANFDETRLTSIAVTTGQRLPTGAYVTRGFQDLPELPLLVEQCQWVLIPIGPERSKGLFAVSASRAEWIAKMQEWCEREGRNSAQLRLRGDTVEVIDRAAPQKYRTNAIHHSIDRFLGEMEVFFGGADESILPSIRERIGFRSKLREEIARTQGPPPC